MSDFEEKGKGLEKYFWDFLRTISSQLRQNFVREMRKEI